MTGKHYKWQARWRVDLAARTATHESGLVVHFARNPDDDRWGGRAEETNAQSVYAGLVEDHGAHNAPQMMARLLREAGEIFTATIQP